MSFMFYFDIRTISLFIWNIPVSEVCKQISFMNYYGILRLADTKFLAKFRYKFLRSKEIWVKCSWVVISFLLQLALQGIYLVRYPSLKFLFDFLQLLIMRSWVDLCLLLTIGVPTFTNDFDLTHNLRDYV